MNGFDPRALIDDRPNEGIFRVHRRVFSDPEIFDLEMRHLFESGWVFLGLESQLPCARDFLLTRIGRQPILLMRGDDGVIRAFYNTCPHRGAAICSLERGNKRLHVCPYHSWSFDSSGRNVAIKAKADGAYPESFLAASHDLIQVARFDTYRGLMFGSLHGDVPSLRDYLGSAAQEIDLIVDQSSEGPELVPGTVSFTFQANWKQQLENCSDHYHLTSVHPTYLQIAKKRAAAVHEENPGVEGVWERTNMFVEENAAGSQAGTFSFVNGHVLSWVAAPASAGHALFERREEIAARVGKERRDWMFYFRNLTIFPNVQFAENFSSQLRIMRPLAPDRTEMLTFCLAPKGESAQARKQRLRQYEDFFSPSGMATPDDISVYEDCQAGHRIVADDGWLDGYSRGGALDANCASSAIHALDWQPVRAAAGSSQLSDETAFQTYYRTWRDRMSAAMARTAEAVP